MGTSELGRWPALPEVTSHADHRQLGIWVHRSRTLRREDVRVRRGIRTTSAARTIADVARRLTDTQLTRATQNSRRAGHIKDSELPGLLCHNLPMPQINVKSHGREADAVFPAERVIIELDSWKYHGDPIAFRSDGERDTAHAANGFLPLRLTGDRLTEAEAERLRGILRARR